MTDNKQSKIEIIDTKYIFQNLKDLYGLLNKASKHGTFDLDEANQIYNIMNSITKAISNLDTLQKIIIENSENSKELKKKEM